MYFITFCILASAANTVFAQYPLPANGSCSGSCQSSIDVKPDYFFGIWFLVQQIPFEFMKDSRCGYINVTSFNETVNKFFLTETLSDNSVRVNHGFVNFRGNGHLDITYTDLDLPYKYEVLAVSKDIFAVVTCTECGFYEKEGSGFYVQIFTRQQKPDCDLVSHTTEIFSVCGIPANATIPVDQDKCQASC